MPSKEIIENLRRRLAEIKERESGIRESNAEPRSFLRLEDIPGVAKQAAKSGSFFLLGNDCCGSLAKVSGESSLKSLLGDLTLVFGVRRATAGELRRDGFHDMESLRRHERFGAQASEIMDMLEQGDMRRITRVAAERDGISSPHIFRLASRYDPEEMLFVDIETMGLFHGNMIFLIGAGFQDDKGLHIEQFFASSGGEEKAILSAFNGKAAGMKCYVSFCGAHFDIPFIRQRSAYYGIRMPPDHFHFDLYRFANRLWRGILPDCRLETIGTMALGERRSSVDIPSSLVPHHYQMFLRTGNASHIRPVLEHNRMDIAVMFRLYNKLAEIFV